MRFRALDRPRLDPGFADVSRGPTREEFSSKPNSQVIFRVAQPYFKGRDKWDGGGQATPTHTGRKNDSTRFALALAVIPSKTASALPPVPLPINEETTTTTRRHNERELVRWRTGNARAERWFPAARFLTSSSYRCAVVAT